MGLSDFADKAKDLADDHPDQAEDVLKKAGDELDSETGNKYSDQIDAGENKAEGALGIDGQQGDQNQNQDQQNQDQQNQ